MLLGHVTEWRKMIENARLKASASSLLPAYASKQNQTLHCMPLSPIHGKHQQIRTHTWWHTATQATHTPCYRFFLKITPCYCFNGKLNTILLSLYCPSIEVWSMARGFLQSFASCSSWSVLQAVAAACSWLAEALFGWLARVAHTISKNLAAM